MSSPTASRLLLAPTLVAVCLASACSDAADPLLEGRLGELVAEGRYLIGEPEETPGMPLRFDEQPHMAELAADDERRPVVVTSLGSWSWRGRMPHGARLVLGAHGLSEGNGAGLEVTVKARSGPERSILARARAGAGEWIDLQADLARFGGRHTSLEVEARRLGNLGSGEALGGQIRVAWGPVSIVTAPRDEERPNIVLIVVDTLRADRMAIYGHRRPTSRQVERHLTRRGVVVEEAYAPSSWTLPSAVSLLASRWPGEVLTGDIATFGVPAKAPVLPELLREAGYATGGFIANPTMHRGNGFAKGFEAFYVPEDAQRALQELHAGDLSRRAAHWVAAHRDRPFFLYAHFMDPHDPYESPDLLPGGRSRFHWRYRGSLSGQDVHSIYLGLTPLENPVDDVRHLLALYDSEIAWVDRFIGKLVACLPRSVARQTLFVLTSDHGEEFFERGGWKHGRTVYQEQIRVPLVARWDGVLPAGRRLPGPVRLLDLAPTLAAAAGLSAPPEWQGRNLLPVLTGEEPQPPLTLFAQHLSSGPVRAAALADGWKLILFDRYAAFEPVNWKQEVLWHQERARLERIELYDLARDPGEQENLATREPRRIRRLSPTIHAHLAQHLPGVRLLLTGVEPGVEVRGTVTFERPPDSWSSYFLGPEDHATIEGRELHFTWRGEALEKGVRVEGEVGGVVRVEIHHGPPLTVALGRERRLPEEGAPLEAFLHDGWPGAPPTPALLLWSPAQPDLRDDPPVDEETLRRLRALGYAA